MSVARDMALHAMLYSSPAAVGRQLLIANATTSDAVPTFGTAVKYLHNPLLKVGAQREEDKWLLLS